MDYTPEQLTDIQEREKAFMEEYQAVSQKNQIDMGTMPVWVPVGDGSFKMTVQTGPVDLKYAPTVSPIQRPVIE